MTLNPRDLMAGLVLEDGRTWGQAAHDWQREDAEAILQPHDGPRRHYLLRGRGMSKTTDVAALVLALLLTEAPERARLHVYAVDGDQAQIFADTVAGLVGRTPGLASALTVNARSVTVLKTGATLTVEASDGASAYGTRPWLTVVDELGAWPASANHRRLWSAIVSAVPKVPGARLIVIGTAGSPIGLGAEVWQEASTSAHWRAVRRPGPSPWWTPADVASTQADLTSSEWRRLILCEWAETDDALTSVEDVEAAIRPGNGALEPVTGRQYVAALDVGTRRDLTALAVGHTERTEAGRVVVIDRVLTWRPDSSAGRVDLAEVEAATLRLCQQYHARLRFDRMQAEQLTGNLARQGVNVEEFVFSTSGANRLARAVFTALRDRALTLPDDEETRAEFLSVRLVETGPGTVKLANPPGSHDDIVTAVGMVVTDLTEQPEPAPSRITIPTGRLPERARLDARPSLPQHLAVRQAQARGPRGIDAIPVPGSANDPSRWRP